MLKNIVAACVVGAIGVAGSVSSASAAVVSGTFDVTIWNGSGGGNPGQPQNQANTSNPFFTSGLAGSISSGTYTGAINFLDNTVDTIGAFLSSAGGLYTATTGDSLATLGTVTLSTLNYGITTLIEISQTGTNPGPLSGDITHDDGITLYDGPSPFVNTVVSAAGPTAAEDSPFTGLSAPWQLLYVEANGLPAELVMTVNATPLPQTWIMLLGALSGLAFFAYRGKSKQDRSVFGATA